MNLESCWLALSPFDVASRSSLGFLNHELVDGSLGHPTNLYYFSAKDRVPTKLCSHSGSVDVNQPKQHTLHGYHQPLQHLRLALRHFFAFSSVQGKAILLGGSVRRVWLPFPRNSHREPEEPFSVLNALGVRLFRAFVLTSRPPRFRGA